MASGSAGRPNSSPKSFDFGSDDILCSFEDYGKQDPSNGSHTDPVSVTNSTKVRVGITCSLVSVPTFLLWVIDVRN